MIELCDCENPGIGNLGFPSCQVIAGVTGSMFIMPTFKSDGTRNSIDLVNDTLDTTFIEGKLYNSDPSERWQFIPEIDNVQDVRAETLKQELDSGKKKKIRPGIRSVQFDIFGMSYTWLGKFQSTGCTDMSYIPIDIDGNMKVIESADGTLAYPIRIDSQSFDPIYVEATDTEAPVIRTMFDWKQTEQDAELKLITPSEYTFDLEALRSMIDVNLVEDSNVTPSTTEIGVVVTMDYGTAFNKKPVTGLVLSDFATASGGVTKTADSVTETADGVYLFDFTGDPLTAATDATVDMADDIKWEENATLTIAIP